MPVLYRQGLLHESLTPQPLTTPSNRQSEFVGYPFPTDLDITAYEEVGRQAARLTNPNDSKRPERKTAFSAYASGWNGVVARYRAATESNAEFATTFSSGAVGFEVMYQRERNMFECVCALLSAFECLCFAAYCISTEFAGSPLNIRTARDLRLYGSHVAAEFKKWFPQEDITFSLNALCASLEYAQLKDLRNFLSHRGIPPQLVRMSTLPHPPQHRQMPINPQDLGADHTFGIDISPGMLDPYVIWVRGAINACTKNLAKFLAPQVPA